MNGNGGRETCCCCYGFAKLAQMVKEKNDGEQTETVHGEDGGSHDDQKEGRGRGNEGLAS